MRMDDKDRLAGKQAGRQEGTPKPKAVFPPEYINTEGNIKASPTVHRTVTTAYLLPYLLTYSLHGAESFWRS